MKKATKGPLSAGWKAAIAVLEAEVQHQWRVRPSSLNMATLKETASVELFLKRKAAEIGIDIS